jgi:Cu/Zn superoxide dismutase
MSRRHPALLISVVVVFSLSPPARPLAETCFNAVIDGTQAGTISSATGIGKFVLNDDETALTFHVTFVDLEGTETAAHIHNDAEGGAVVKGLGLGSPKFGTWTSTDPAPLNAQRIANLKAGLLYVNIHSTQDPNGEIRGQILLAPCEEQCFDASIDGSATGTPGTGTGRFALNHTETELAYWVEFSGLTAAQTAAHIHNTAEGGGIVRTLANGSPTSGVWKFTDSPALTAQRVDDLKAGNLYVNIHTTAFPSGEIRGDLLPGTCQPTCFAAHLDGAAAGTTSVATGEGFFQLSHARNRLAYGVTTTGVVDETGAHIHSDDEGGAIVHPLDAGMTKAGEWDGDDSPAMTQARVVSLLNDRLYVNVHTTAFPGGEIRGQLLLVSCAATGVNGDPKLRTALEQNHPNPFNPSTTISFTLAVPGTARLDVYDVNGRLVAALVRGFRPAGRSEVNWNGTDSRGHPVASGVYFYRLVAGAVSETRRMVLLK